MILVVIPARYGSTRFPGKPLARLGDKSVIQHVYERVRASTQVQRIVVATDDRRIMEHVQAFGGLAELTRADHVNGTSRVAEVAARYPAATIVVNVQGDEPFIEPRQVDDLLAGFSDPGVDLATLAHPIADERALLSPNVVKVVLSATGKALYFSRHAIPFLRDVPVGRWVDQKMHLQHLGVYAYRAPVLQRIVQLPPDDLETAESLEQLRWLRAGLSIHVPITPYGAFGIDTPEDLALATERLLQRGTHDGD